MALQTSGAISLNDIHVEAGGSSGTQVTINDSDVRDLISASSASEMEFADFYGASAETVLTSAGTVNGQAQRQEITVSSFISSGGTLRIPSSIWVWSNSTSTPALTIDISCTIINEGKIIGKGGNGGFSSNSSSNRAGKAGGPAIKINSGVTGVTITNSSGAYIAGGGGGGGSSSWAGGGGGAGGGTSGPHGFNGNRGGAQSGGALNAVGSGYGGGAGGAGGYGYGSGSDIGGGGGRQLPGSGGVGARTDTTLGYGGAGGNAGNNGAQLGDSHWGGGGGGWGASGGSSYGGSGSGGQAINDSGNSYTLSNSGTIYGGT